MFWVSLTLSLFLAIYQPSVHALPLAASANAQPAQGTTNATEIQALTVIANTLFRSQAQQIAYGWLLNIDPCGYQSCRPRVQPSCSWTGLTCTNWHVTGILLDPSRVTVPSVPAQLKGTISPYIVFLQQLQSLQLGDQGDLPFGATHQNPTWPHWPMTVADCLITGTLPRVLGLLSNLTTLDLSSNQMTGFLPTTWGLLSNLTTLTLANNSLEGSVPSSWTGMTNLNTLDLTDNPSFCNPIPNITALSAASFANSALSFPACNASILAAQAASNTSPAPSSSPSASPSASPSPEAISPAASNYHTSPGINVAVSILVGLCFLLGICGGFVRIRQQQRRHRQLLIGLNQQRRDLAQLRDNAPAFGTSQFEAYAAATTPFCSTPRLVLGPDGQQLALARKLKQQNFDTKSAVDGSNTEGAGQGSCSTGLSDTVNLPVRSPYQHHTKLYTAYLEVDNQEAEKVPMPVDLVSPIDPISKLEPTRMGSGLQHQSAALQVEARQPSITGGMLGRVSHSLSRLSAQSLPPEPAQDSRWQSRQTPDDELRHPDDHGFVNSSSSAQHETQAEQQSSSEQPRRLWWFRRGH